MCAVETTPPNNAPLRPIGLMINCTVSISSLLATLLTPGLSLRSVFTNHDVSRRAPLRRIFCRLWSRPTRCRHLLHPNHRSHQHQAATFLACGPRSSTSYSTTNTAFNYHTTSQPTPSAHTLSGQRVPSSEFSLVSCLGHWGEWCSEHFTLHAHIW